MTRNSGGDRKNPFFGKMREGKISDPYMLKEGWKEPSVCKRCNAIYSKKRWAFNPKLLTALKKDKKLNYISCPACRKIMDKFPMGIINITGDFVSDHKNEIINLIKSEERRAMEKNPLERLIAINKSNGGITVETTAETLALRIAKVLNRSYKGGKVKFDFHAGDNQIDIKWHRDK